MPNVVLESVFVGLDSWIIQDGNYCDFQVGEKARFALEFYPQHIQIAKFHEVAFERIRADRYRVRGSVIYADRASWVIDFGMMAYQNRAAPRLAKKGNWVEGEIYLGIDPFFYFEELHARKGMPALQYEWRIKSILLETTPWVKRKDESGRTILNRAEQQASYVEVAETNAGEDDEGHGHYVLECVKIG